jgi:hypothetical protein
VTEEVCEEKAVEVESVEPSMGCEEGWTMDAATGTCSNGDAKVKRVGVRAQGGNLRTRALLHTHCTLHSLSCL